MKYLKQFIAGSSFIISAPFYYGFNKIKKKDYSYFNYTFIVPLWFGIWNIISFILAKKLKLSMKKRFLITSIITYIFAISYTTYNNVYNFTTYQWYIYYFCMLLLYLFVWNVCIFQIEKLIS